MAGWLRGACEAAFNKQHAGKRVNPSPSCDFLHSGLARRTSHPRPQGPRSSAEGPSWAVLFPSSFVAGATSQHSAVTESSLQEAPGAGPKGDQIYLQRKRKRKWDLSHSAKNVSYVFDFKRSLLKVTESSLRMRTCSGVGSQKPSPQLRWDCAGLLPSREHCGTSFPLDRVKRFVLLTQKQKYPSGKTREASWCESWCLCGLLLPPPLTRFLHPGHDQRPKLHQDPRSARRGAARSPSPLERRTPLRQGAATGKPPPCRRDRQWMVLLLLDSRCCPGTAALLGHVFGAVHSNGSSSWNHCLVGSWNGLG